MNILVGHGLYLQMPFADGGACTYPRTFLVIYTNITGKLVRALNVSSISGKSHKALFPSNLVINNYNPPFCKPSFVKLDALYELEYFSGLDKAILGRRGILDSSELNRILAGFENYRSKNNVTVVSYEESQIRKYNPQL